MVDRTTLVGHINAGVIMTVVNLHLVMRMRVVDSTCCSQIICNVALSLDIVLKVGNEQRRDRGQLSN
jgi:hypothetical protein